MSFGCQKRNISFRDRKHRASSHSVGQVTDSQLEARVLLTTTIGFDDLPQSTVLSQQYDSLGVDFNGTASVETADSMPYTARSGTNYITDSRAPDHSGLPGTGGPIMDLVQSWVTKTGASDLF